MQNLDHFLKNLDWNEINDPIRGRVFVANAQSNTAFIEYYMANHDNLVSEGIRMDDSGLVYKQMITHVKAQTNELAIQYHKLFNGPDAVPPPFPERDQHGPRLEGTFQQPRIQEVESTQNATIPQSLKRYENTIMPEPKPINDDHRDQEIRKKMAEKIIKKIELKYADELYDYQHEHTKLLIAGITKHDTVIDASDTGTGKTHCSIIAAKNLNYNIVVICPKSVIPSWQRAGKLHDYNVTDSITPFVSNKKKDKTKFWIFVSNYEQFKNGNTPFLNVGRDDQDKPVYEWDFPEGTILIVDECHRAKNHKTQNSKMLYAAFREKVPMFLLSATLIDRVIYMYTVGYLTGLYSSHMEFKQWVKNRQFDVRSNPDTANKNQSIQDACLKALHKHIFPIRGSRMSVAQLGNLFPENLIIYEPVVIGSQNKEVQKIYHKAIKRIKKIIEDKGTSQCILTELIRARQAAELMKVPIIAEQVEDAIEEGKSVAIFMNFNESIEELAVTLNTDCVITGENPEERQSFIDRFQSNESKVIICNAQAGGEGISLHDTIGKHPRISFIVPSWSAMSTKQCLGRIARAGAKSKCIQKILYCSDSIEETVVGLIKQKINNINMINDGPVQNLLEALGYAHTENEIDEILDEKYVCHVVVETENVYFNIYKEDFKDGDYILDISQKVKEYRSNPTSENLKKTGVSILEIDGQIQVDDMDLESYELLEDDDPNATWICWKEILDDNLQDLDADEIEDPDNPEDLEDQDQSENSVYDQD